ncbi:MAG: tail protein X [Gammaproteobacteria bacterium]|nr:tail protein X [Gammaproteobacteria bacterium]NNJ83491.1 hypothetical protein [Gammaproteobacteria bacterium]
MSIIYKTRDGDVLDQICWKRYGQTMKRMQTAMKIDPSYVQSLTESMDEFDTLGSSSSVNMEGVVEKVMEANPGLVNEGPVFSSGIEIVLPDLTDEIGEKEVDRLWD